ncbi:MAG: B12-binding domain-containing radical SAM protein [Flavobacteriales bacterium]
MQHNHFRLAQVLLLIPPLTQLNTPYPATAYLSGFLKSRGISFHQGDLGLDLFLTLFSRHGISEIMDAVEKGGFTLSAGSNDVLKNRIKYEETIDEVISFLQNRNYTLAYRIARRKYLPEGKRFDTIPELNAFFGSIGTQDQARYLCTLYLEDLGDLIQESVGPQFGFSKYAERIARTATSFTPLNEELEKPNNFLDQKLQNQLMQYFENEIPAIVGFTVPFSGNLYGALKCGQWIKKHYPETRIVLGGGYANTELRDLTDPRVFDYLDYITLDDGETPLEALCKNILDGEDVGYKQTFVRRKDEVKLLNTYLGKHYSHAQTPAPTYEGLRLEEYLSMYDVPNPMHRLWNDGRWNKLTIAHGCYWKKCSFCDITLDYISRFDQAPAKLLVDKMETLIAETGETGFHFVDEAAPPLAMRDLAIEIISRGLQVTWWTNIRFEKTFTPDLAKLLAASGCIAVTGGLEVASPRLLEFMEKGITIEQVSKVCAGFRDAGILVHAYLMYGFPTETEQETIDSLEIVRQLFENGLLQSAFWHQFAMTVHSPVGKDPAKYQVVRTGPEFEGFANNDLFHEDPTGADHERFSEGLKKALYNYMHGRGFDFPLRDFFDFLVPHTEIPKKLISKYLNRPVADPIASPGYVLMWEGIRAEKSTSSKNKSALNFYGKRGNVQIEFPEKIARWIEDQSANLDVRSGAWPELATTLQNWSELVNLSPEKIVTENWWKKWRAEVVWVIRK